MKVSQKGLDLIKEFEGCRLKAYKDAVGIWTVGYGSTSADYSIIGTYIYEGLTITQETADEWLRKSVDAKYAPNVMKYDNIYHWNQNQFDALVSFAYNVGSINALTGYGTRTIAEISSKILAYNRAGTQILAGLTRRRQAEKALFDTPYENNWLKTDKGWRYKDGDDVVRNKWKEIDGKWYYFKANGYMASDEYIKASDYATSQKLYYCAKDGAWNDKSYRWLNDKVGYWLAEIGAKWYAKSEWAKVDDKWYYFDSSGYMVTGIKKIGGKTYTFSSDGHMIG